MEVLIKEYGLLGLFSGMIILTIKWMMKKIDEQLATAREQEEKWRKIVEAMTSNIVRQTEDLRLHTEASKEFRVRMMEFEVANVKDHDKMLKRLKEVQ